MKNSQISSSALNKVKNIYPQFKNITKGLNKILAIEFGYMKLFRDSNYFKIMDNLECLEEFITHVNQSHIFCERNVTNHFDTNYHFTLWPNEPTCKAMEIYKYHNVWHGITVSKINKDYAELYWFTKQDAEDDWHKFFIRNKALLMEFIAYFDSCKNLLQIPKEKDNKDLFNFKYGFDLTIPDSIYIQNDKSKLTKIIKLLHSPSTKEQLYTKIKFSHREIEVLDIICCGYTYKDAAHKLCISPKTVHYHLEHIKSKIGLRSKSDLIDFYTVYKR